MDTTFRESVRDMKGLTVGLERRALQWMAPRLPQAINSDHLTALAAVAMLLAGVSYALSGHTPWLLWVVNGLLVVNWFGDSLDGTLARVRQHQRPRYGFYVDHVVDVAGAAALLTGLGASGYMSPLVACAMLAAYLLLSVEIYLATYCVGRFVMSVGGIGGTELRLIVMTMNALLFAVPTLGWTIAGHALAPLDPLGALVVVGLVIAFGLKAARHTRQLFAEEPIPPAI
jgi:phosphatidylglycerophosphate synthase